VTDIAALRFLVVEDHSFQRWFMGDLLQKLGAREVFLAGDGTVALELLRTPQPPVDVVITDLDMPRMDGMELIRRMAELNHPASLIVVSALERTLVATVEAMAREYGVKLLGAIAKPLTTKKLRQVLESLQRTEDRAQATGSAESFTDEEVVRGLQRNEFEAFFQPKVEIRTRQTRGAEALARWRHPDKGLVSPGAFLDAVVKAGMIDELTQKIAWEAALNCRIWLDAGMEIPVSVNLSPDSLSNVALVDRLTALAENAGIEPRHMILEITESAAGGNLGKSLEILSRLRMKGFGLSIDDFGTGHSNMERLARVPFTELKIDQAFVRGALSQASSRAVVESSLELAEKLGIAAVAEGVETPWEWQLLMAMGCSLAQGYFLAKPMEPAAFLEWVQSRQRDTG